MIIDYTIRRDDMNLFFWFYAQRSHIYSHNTIGTQISYCVYIIYAILEYN